MSVYKITSEITINKSVSEVFNFLTTVRNWGGLHPCTKEVIGPAGCDSPAVPGLLFTERVETPGLKIFLDWEVRKVVKNEYFEIVFPAEFRKGPLNEMIVTYNLGPLGKDKTRFVRNMINICTPEATEEETQALRESHTHDEYVKLVKAKLEG